MPDADQTVLVYVPDDENEPVGMGHTDGEAWFSLEGFEIGPVTHWMQLPDPPLYDQQT